MNPSLKSFAGSRAGAALLSFAWLALLAWPRPLMLPDEGRYVGVAWEMMRSGDWLDRVVARGLGPVGPAALEVSAVGVLLERAGQVPLFVPRGDLVAVGTGTGIAGEVVERDGMVIVGWRLGDERLDTGFRASTTAEQRAALDALAGLVDAESANTSGGRS